jgi:hypothetical protein
VTQSEGPFDTPEAGKTHSVRAGDSTDTLRLPPKLVELELQPIVIRVTELLDEDKRSFLAERDMVRKALM